MKRYGILDPPAIAPLVRFSFASADASASALRVSLTEAASARYFRVRHNNANDGTSIASEGQAAAEFVIGNKP